MGTCFRRGPARPRRRLWLAGAGLLLLIPLAAGVIFFLKPFAPAGGPIPPEGGHGATAPPAAAGENPPKDAVPLQAEPPTVLRDVHEVASGDLGIRFIGYDAVANGLFALVDETNGEVRVHLVEWRDGTFTPGKQLSYPAGKMLEVSFGDFYNEGYGDALVTTDRGLLFVQEDGRMEFREQSGLLKAYVGDWDGDDRRETAYFTRADGATQVTILRHFRGGRTEKVGAFRAESLPRWMAGTVLDAGERRLLLGASPTEAESVSIGLYALDPAKGLARLFGGTIPNRQAEPLISSAAGILDGKPAFVASYRGQPSYAELFDIGEKGLSSRGRILLPSGEDYFIMAGRFTGSTTELLAITRTGKWTLYGF